MSAPRPLETEYLAQAEKALADAVSGFETNLLERRLQVLEAVSARFGGFNLAAYQKKFGIAASVPASELLDLAAPIASAIEQTPIHHALALSALAREALEEHNRKNTGAYHTDFRLAERLAQLAAPKLTYTSVVIDPACGAGILLAALTLTVCGVDRAKISIWLANGVCAADLSANSLRATLLSLASFTDDLSALGVMRSRWAHGDSLMADSKFWQSMAPEGFDAVIGNPPWEKVKLSRHEFLKSTGAKRHYGDQIVALDEDLFKLQREEVANYSRQLFERYPLLGSGDPDLYIAFSLLFLDLCKVGGVVAAILPGGLIRSQGTQAVREKLFECSQSLSVSIIDNRSRFFAIDTRFKFLAVVAAKAASSKSRRSPIQLFHERGTPTNLITIGSATIGRRALEDTRPDLSLPEVRSLAEWKIFLKASGAGCSWQDPEYGWRPEFCREVDMSKDRPKFLNHQMEEAFPLVEGRMVQSHRFGVKGHISGTGRKAIWKAYPIGCSCLSPQFWIRSCDLSAVKSQRSHSLRVGFCDIAGQTNERSMMATIIPSGVVCGNKVPTISFPDDPSEERMLVWTAVVNSFVFDWMLRRVLTTTVNYFVLQSIQLPRLSKSGLPWKKLAGAAATLRKFDSAGHSHETMMEVARLRGEIDAEVAVAYGLSQSEVELIMQDFPILDRGQPPLPEEDKSTVTRDTVLAAVAKRMGSRSSHWSRRQSEANCIGAVPYVPSELALAQENPNEMESKIHG